MEKLSVLSEANQDLNAALDKIKDIKLTSENAAENEQSKNFALPDPIPFMKPCNLLHLNDDCLLHILSMLPVVELVSLRLTHSRFKPLLHITTKNQCITFEASPETLSKCPLATSMDRYRILGQITSVLVLDQLDEKVVTTLLPLFPNLRSLFLNVPQLKDIKAINTFPIPEGLKLTIRNVEKNYLDALLIRFAPRLKVLDSIGTPKADFRMLQNVTELGIDVVCLSKKSKFWRTNKTLKTLFIHNQEDEANLPVLRKNLTDIAKMECLNKLIWHKVGWRNLDHRIIPQFVHVTELHFNFTDPFLILSVLNGIGPNLKTLYMTNPSFLVDEFTFTTIIELFTQTFPQLEKLLLIIDYNIQEDHIRPLFVLKNLTECRIMFDPTPDFTFEMVKAWPKLCVLGNKNKQMVSPELLTYLKRENRRMNIGGDDYPANI